MATTARQRRGLAQGSKTALQWAYGKPGIFPISVDLAAWVVGLSCGAVLKLLVDLPQASIDLVVTEIVAVALHAAIGLFVGLYRHRWRVTSFDEVSSLAMVWAVTAATVTLGTFVARQLGTALPTSAVAIGAVLSLAIMGFIRIVWRRYWERMRRPDEEFARRTIVFGAGEGGAQIIRAMLVDPNSQYLPVALLDDDPRKRSRELHGVRVMGTRHDLPKIAEQRSAEFVLIAIRSATSSLIQEVSEQAVEHGLEVRVLPAASELVGKMTLADVRPPTVEDLLGRDPVEIDLESVSDFIRGKRVLVTGAGGSIGSELARQVRGFEPAELYLLDRDENALHALQLSMDGHGLLDTKDLIVANIRDRQRVFELFDTNRPEVVFHAAALKHLPLLENHPGEGIKTNTLGTKNLLDAAMSVGVERFVNISTDKAADPTSVLGATKLAAERLTAEAAEETGVPYVSVRFGNVLGSNGSVLPTFLEQIQQGKPVTVTHPDVTRFFMTIPEAVRLVVQAGAIGEPGDVMILDMGEPVKIFDIAKQLINTLKPGASIEFTGLRPGEKLHEVLVGATEEIVQTSHPRITATRNGGGSPRDALAVLHQWTIELDLQLGDLGSSDLPQRIA